MKKHLVIWLTLLLGLILAACSSSPTATLTPTADASSSAAPAVADELTQANGEAMVTVAVTPLNLDDKSAATLDFEIVLNTHSVDLGYDLTQIATLSNDAGEKVQPTKWGGPGGGGHHREGTLSFPPLKKRSHVLTLTLRGIADIPERTFTWRVN